MPGVERQGEVPLRHELNGRAGRRGGRGRIPVGGLADGRVGRAAVAAAVAVGGRRAAQAVLRVPQLHHQLQAGLLEGLLDLGKPREEKREVNSDVCGRGFMKPL